jgi:MFS family permease
VAQPDDDTRAFVTGRWGRTFLSLRVRNFRLFFFGQLISNTGNWLTIVGLTLLVLHLTKSGLAVGVLSACQFGPLLVLSPFAGAVADRSKKRNLLFVTQTLEMLQSFTLAALAFLAHPPVLALYVTAFAGGCMLAFDNPLRRSFVTEMVPVDHVPNAVTLYSALVNASRIFGPTIAGFLIVTLGFGWAFTIDGISYVAVIAALWLMRPSELRVAPPVKRGKRQVREGIAYVRRTPELAVSFWMLLLIGTLSYNFTVVLPLFVVRALSGSDTSYTILYSLFSVGSLAGALAVAHRNEVSVRVMIGGAALFGVALFALAASPNVGVAALMSVAVGATSIVYMTASTTIVQIRAEPTMLGRVLALQSALLIGTTPVGGPFLGAVADAVGARAPLVIGGVGALAAAAFGMVYARRHGIETVSESGYEGRIAG